MGKDPSWMDRSLSLTERLDDLRREEATGPCAQSSAVLRRRQAKNELLSDAIFVIQLLRKRLQLDTKEA